MQRVNGSLLSEVTASITRHCADLLTRYGAVYETMRRAHPVYGVGGWHAPVTDPHRFMNFVAVAEYAHECDGVWIDIGAYDGALVAMLRRYAVRAYGMEVNEWPEMWAVLGVQEYMNRPLCAEEADVISVLNYAHAFEPEDFLQRTFAQFGEPRMMLVDREARTPHPNNKLWFDEARITALGFDVILSYPDAAAGNIDYGRELLVRRRI